MLAGVNPLPIKDDFDARLDLLCENINKDYVNWSNGRASLGDLKGMIKIKPGRKFIKIIRENSVWGFVGKTDGIHKGIPYKAGDVFKAAGWSAPAKHVRGSIFSDETNWFHWTGPQYL
jgi:hypothetical protein